MYFEKDYILRQIWMATEFIRRLLHLGEDQVAADSEKELDALSRELVGLDIRSLAMTMLLRAENPEGVADVFSQPVAGELLAAFALLLERTADFEGAQHYGEAALVAISETTDAEDIAGERLAGLRLLLGRLPEAPSPGTQFALARFYYMAGEYAWMEDALFHALEDADDQHRKAVIAWGIDAYNKLLGAGGEDGGLSRAERQETLDELHILEEKNKLG